MRLNQSTLWSPLSAHWFVCLRKTLMANWFAFRQSELFSSSNGAIGRIGRLQCRLSTPSKMAPTRSSLGKLPLILALSQFGERGDIANRFILGVNVNRYRCGVAKWKASMKLLGSLCLFYRRLRKATNVISGKKGSRCASRVTFSCQIHRLGKMSCCFDGRIICQCTMDLSQTTLGVLSLAGT